MTMLIRAVPVLPARDIQATTAFYQQLGFTVEHQAEDYGIIERDSVEIHFWKCEDKYIADNSSCRLMVEGIDGLYEQFQGVIHPKAPLAEKPYGVREFAIVDLNGNLVWFVEPIG